MVPMISLNICWAHCGAIAMHLLGPSISPEICEIWILFLNILQQPHFHKILNLGLMPGNLQEVEVCPIRDLNYSNLDNHWVRGLVFYAPRSSILVISEPCHWTYCHKHEFQWVLTLLWCTFVIFTGLTWWKISWSFVNFDGFVSWEK